MTRSDNLSIPNLAVLFLGTDFGLGDPLHAVSAFLHDPAAANCYVRVPEELEAGSIPVCELKKVKAPNFVRTVIGAIAGPNATVIHHVVQAFRAVGCGLNWADQLTRGVFTVLTQYGLKVRFRIIRVAPVITVYADPVHFAAMQNFLLAHNRDVVFRLAGNDTGIAAYATIQVDDHPPGITGV